MPASPALHFQLRIALGQPERYHIKYYDTPHKFNTEVREEVFTSLEEWLR